MDSENFENIFHIFNNINIENEPGTEKYEIYATKPYIYKNIPKQKLPSQKLNYIDFELYIKENFDNKIKLVEDPLTFSQIQKPFIIFFHHFRVKCAYLKEWLDKIYHLALKYGNAMDFIVADLYNIDLIFPGVNPINLYYRFERPQEESPRIYIVDEKKRIYQHLHFPINLENLIELCENFLKGKLFPSQPLPQNNDKNLVKICVYDNYEELVLKSNKNIFLIINLPQYQVDEPSYENVAKALKDYNLDIAYIDCEKNYIPFEICNNCYPTMIFIPYNNKKKFVYYDDFRNEHKIKEFLKKCLEQPEYLKSLQEEQKSNLRLKDVKVSYDFSLNWNDLPRFLQEHYDVYIKILDPEILEKSKKFSLIMFMNFQEKCLAYHVDCLNKLFQVAENSCSFDIFVADFKDINIINDQWNIECLIEFAQGKPKIYGFDRLKNIYEFGNFNKPADLFYFTDDLLNGDLFYSEAYNRNQEKQLVKEWTANYLKIFIKYLKKHIFITFYNSDDKNEKLFDLLLSIAKDVEDLNIEIVKFDVKYNYLSLEYQQNHYPFHYFIGKNNKRNKRLLLNCNLNRDKILRFIKNNLENK